MLKFDLSQIQPADIVAVRSNTRYGKLIRAVLGSYTNHDGLFAEVKKTWYIAEAVEPVSELTPVSEYECKINLDPRDKEYVDLRVWRVRKLSDKERSAIAAYASVNLIGKKYPWLSVARLWVFRFVNKLPWKISGEWCSALVADAIRKLAPDALLRPDGKPKKNWTPRTFENRLVAGVLEDVTASVVVDV